MASILKQRRDTAANWTSANPVIPDGQLCFDTTNNTFRIGDGTTVHDSLPVQSGVAGAAGGLQDIVDDTTPQLGGDLDFQTHKATSFTSTGIDDNATSTAITIDASENVGIGTATPDGKLHIDGTSTTVTGLVLEAGTAGDCRSVDFHNSDGNKRIGIGYDNTNIKLNITDRSENKLVTIGELTGDVTVGTGNLVIGTSGKGIDFSAVSDGSRSVAANVLDDYEEGTWTPTSANGGTITFIVYYAKYVKVGGLVHWQMYLDVNALGDTTFLQITLPFACQTNGYATGTMNVNVTGAVGENPHFRVRSNTAIIEGKYSGSATMKQNECGSDHIIASGTYYTATN
jgi:hypothetical protein